MKVTVWRNDLRLSFRLSDKLTGTVQKRLISRTLMLLQKPLSKVRLKNYLTAKKMRKIAFH